MGVSLEICLETVTSLSVKSYIEGLSSLHIEQLESFSSLFQKYKKLEVHLQKISDQQNQDLLTQKPELRRLQDLVRQHEQTIA